VTDQPGAGLGAAALIGFVSTTDLGRAETFYRDVLGLRHVETSPFACVFDAGGTMLRVTAASTVAQPGYTVLGWRVDDIAGTMARLVGRGVVFRRYDGMSQDESGVWTTPDGAKIAWFADPDGNTLSLTQFPA
jgi:catechol 2,3-dioxygenase-like lactoylglutathione lyase family enzyme